MTTTSARKVTTSRAAPLVVGQMAVQAQPQLADLLGLRVVGLGGVAVIVGDISSGHVG